MCKFDKYSFEKKVATEGIYLFAVMRKQSNISNKEFLLKKYNQ